MKTKKTLVIGASLHNWRYAHIAALKLIGQGYPTLLLGTDSGKILGHSILHETPKDKDIDTVTMYINPVKQQQYEEYLLGDYAPKRIIFNPGAENPGLEARAAARGIETLNACTLIMLNSGQY